MKALLCRPGDCPAEDGCMNEGVADDAVLRDFITPPLKLRLHEHDQVGVWPQRPSHGRDHLVDADERDVKGGEVASFREGSEVTGVRPLHYDDAQVCSQAVVELAVADVDR